MADVYGRLTGRAGVCLATLGPGATNLITGVADANMDRAPLVAIAGQGATTTAAQGEPPDPRPGEPVPADHQVLDPDARAGHRAGDRAQGLQGRPDREARRCFIDFPENIAEMEVDKKPIQVQTRLHAGGARAQDRGGRAADRSRAKCPVILAGNGVIRQGATDSLRSFAEVLRIPVANTFMAKGVMPFSNELSLGTIGLKARDLPWFAFEKADVRDLRRLRHGRVPPGHVEPERRQDHHPHRCAAGGGRRALHRGRRRARRHRRSAARHRAAHAGRSRVQSVQAGARGDRRRPRARYCEDDGFPVKPQKILWDLREALAAAGHRDLRRRRAQDVDRAACTAPSSRTPASSPTASPRWASRVPGALAAKLAYPDRKVVAVTGDAGFMMNSQEIETALRMKTPFVVLIWNDSEYGLITWHQLRHFGRPSHIAFKQSRLRQVRRELRRQGLSRRECGRPAADAEEGARRRHGGDRRLPGRLLGEHEAHGPAEGAEVAAVS